MAYKFQCMGILLLGDKVHDYATPESGIACLGRS